MTEQPIITCPACGSVDIFPFLKTKDFRLTGEHFALEKCPECGLVITSPQPSEDKIGKYYETEDYISHAASARTLMDRIYYVVRDRMARRKMRIIRRFAQGKRMVDIGAGAGHFVSFMLRRGWDVKGFEPSIHARESARVSGGVTLHEMHALFDLQDLSADVVTMWHVLEHVHRTDAYLQSIHRILRNDGVFFLALPNYTSPDAAFYQSAWAAWDVPRHLWHFGPYATKKILERHGFQVVAQYRMPFDAFYVALMSEQYLGGGMLRALRALAIATVSNVVALCSKRRSSSLIYVARKMTHR